MNHEHRRYHVGDNVRIVWEPSHDTYVGWDPDMDEFCGEMAEIMEVGGSTDRPWYRIDLTNSFVWGYDCFQEILPELPCFDASTLDALLSLM